MRTTPLVRLLTCAAAVGWTAFGHADQVHLRNGETLQGQVLSFADLTFQFAPENGAVQPLTTAHISAITFTSSTEATFETRTEGKLQAKPLRFGNGVFVVQVDGRQERKIPVMLVQKLEIGDGDPSQVVEIISRGSRVDLEKHLVRGRVTVVDFYAAWCGPCRVISPYLEKLAGEDPDVVLRKIDIVKWGSPVATQYHIQSIPHIRVFDRRGQLVGEVNGASPSAVQNLVAKAK